MRRRRSNLAAALAAGAALADCRTVKESSRVPDEESAAALPEVVVGATTREDLLLRWGPSSFGVEDDRILAWRLAGSAGPRLPFEGEPALGEMTMQRAEAYALPGDGIGSWDRRAPYSLVVVFAADGTVAGFSLVKVR